MTTEDWISAIGLGIQFLLLIGLVWYTIETRGIRKASDGTLRAMQRQTAATEIAANAARDNAIAARDNAKAAELNAQALINSERAWILAELGWYEGGLHIVESATQVGGLTKRVTEVSLKLTCRNEGRSPAWIENVRGRVDIITQILAAADDSPGSDLASFGPMSPLGAGKEQRRSLQLICSGHARNNQFFSAYVVVEYRDIFGIERKTRLGYSIDPTGEMIYRQDALSERNRNT